MTDTTYSVLTNDGNEMCVTTDPDVARDAAQAAATRLGIRVSVEFSVSYADGRPDEEFRENFMPEVEEIDE